MTKLNANNLAKQKRQKGMFSKKFVFFFFSTTTTIANSIIIVVAPVKLR